MRYDVFIVEGEVFAPDGQDTWIKLENLAEDEIHFLVGLVCRQSRDMDIVIRAKKD